MTPAEYQPDSTLGTRFEEISVGQEIPPLTRGPLTPLHLMRWSSAIENWHRIHYDGRFATEHDALPALLINGTWKQHFLVQMMTDWLGAAGWLAEISFQFRRMDLVDSTLTAWGQVVEKYVADGLGFVVCEIGIRNEEGVESTPGMACAALPHAYGTAVPYPFPREAPAKAE
jgi:acyl dehydratase